MKSDLIIRAGAPPPALAALLPHILGEVADDWHAIEVWLSAVASNSRNGNTSTLETYRYP